MHSTGISVNRTLSEIDKVYGRLNKYASEPERLRYCASLIQRTENYVERHQETMTDFIRRRSGEIIRAAKLEIMQLTKGKRTDN